MLKRMMCLCAKNSTKLFRVEGGGGRVRYVTVAGKVFPNNSN